MFIWIFSLWGHVQWLLSTHLPIMSHIMRQWTGSTLVQVLACRLFGAKPLSEPMLTYCQLGPWEQTSGNSNRNTKLFIHENAFETVVCEMAAILSGGGELFCTWTSVWANVMKDVCPLRGYAKPGQHGRSVPLCVLRAQDSVAFRTVLFDRLRLLYTINVTFMNMLQLHC